MGRSREVERLLRGFGLRLRAARITAGYESAEAFAEELAVDGPRYRKYERGESFPPIDVLKAILELTERRADWLLFGKMSRSATRAAGQADADAAEALEADTDC